MRLWMQGRGRVLRVFGAECPAAKLRLKSTGKSAPLRSPWSFELEASVASHFIEPIVNDVHGLLLVTGHCYHEPHSRLLPRVD